MIIIRRTALGSFLVLLLAAMKCGFPVKGMIEMADISIDRQVSENKAVVFDYECVIPTFNELRKLDSIRFEFAQDYGTYRNFLGSDVFVNEGKWSGIATQSYQGRISSEEQVSMERPIHLRFHVYKKGRSLVSPWLAVHPENTK